MGQCGCCDYHPEFKLKGPAGTVYTIQLDPGCRYCGEHRVGLIVHRLKDETAHDWEAHQTPELEFKSVDDGGNFAEARYLVLNPAHLERKLTEYVETCMEDLDVKFEDTGVDGTLAEIIKHAVEESLREAVFDSRKEDREAP